MRRAALLGAALSLAAMAANAAAPRPDCFSNADVEAEQAVRFQAQLMVLSDICRDSTYGLFTQRNREAIMAYQRQMIDHFKRAGERRADITFENYMTRLANQESILANQSKLDKVLANQATIEANQETIQENQEKIKEAQSTGVEGLLTYLHQEIDIKANRQRIYDALLDSKQFTAFSGAPAEINREAGGTFSLFG